MVHGSELIQLYSLKMSVELEGGGELLHMQISHEVNCACATAPRTRQSKHESINHGSDMLHALLYGSSDRISLPSFSSDVDEDTWCLRRQVEPIIEG